MATDVNDGTTVLVVDPSSSVYHAYECGSGCTDINVYIRYQAGASGNVTTDPISFPAVLEATLWERAQADGTGEITVQNLAHECALLQGAVLPGNSTGITERIVRLWVVDPAVYSYPSVRATLGPGAILIDWSVMANDRWDWRFDNADDVEG